MLGFIKTISIRLLSVSVRVSFGESLFSNLECVSLKNQPCKARQTIVNTISNETLFYLFTVKINKCGGIYNAIDDIYVKRII